MIGMEIIGIYELYVALVGMVTVFVLYRAQNSKAESGVEVEDEVIALGPAEEDQEEEKIYELLWNKDKLSEKPKKRDLSISSKKAEQKRILKQMKAIRRKLHWADRRLNVYPELCKKSTKFRALRFCQKISGHFNSALSEYAQTILNEYASRERLVSNKAQELRLAA